MTDLQDRLVAPCLADPKNGILDAAGLLNRLLLFDEYYLQTSRFREFGTLVRTLGLSKVILLLESGSLKLELNPTTIASIGQTEGVRATGPLPKLSFAYTLIHARYADYLVRSVDKVHKQLFGFVGERDLARLEGALLNALVPMPENPGSSAFRSLKNRLVTNEPILKAAVLMVLERKLRRQIHKSKISLSVVQIGDADFRTESNLSEFGLTTDEVHSVLDSAFLAVGNLELRIEDMSVYNALSGAIDDELPLFEERLDCLRRSVSPNLKEQTFERVLAILDLPSLRLALLNKEFDMELFLRVRNSEDCVAFRDWLKRAKAMSDHEIAERFNSIGARLGNLMQGTVARSIRFALSNGLGMIPGYGLALGPAASALDSFVVDKLFQTTGIAAFLGRAYPSLFKSRSSHVNESTQDPENGRS